MTTARVDAILALQEADKALRRAREATKKLGESEISKDLGALVEDVNDVAAYLVETREGKSVAVEVVS